MLWAHCTRVLIIVDRFLWWYWWPHTLKADSSFDRAVRIYTVAARWGCEVVWSHPAATCRGGAALWPGWVIFQRCANYNFRLRDQLMMPLFDHNKSINILTCLFISSNTFNTCFGQMQSQEIHTESCMISFFSLYFFIYCPKSLWSRLQFMSISFNVGCSQLSSKSST